jgi:nitrogen fixation protein NifB
MSDIKVHPCFNPEAAAAHGRIHLPVAPACNIQCGYCNRSFDCINESRPGVTSKVLTPGQAIWYLRQIQDKVPLSVVGIAGPGDPFANAEATLETLERVKSEFPDLLLCVSTNGLNLLPYIPRLANIGVSHVTVTMNAVDPDIGARVYRWIRIGKKAFRGVEGALLLMENQLAAIKSLKDHGMTVKVNSIVIPGVNDNHIVEVAQEAARRGVDFFNCIPLIPVEGTDFETVQPPGHKVMGPVKEAAGAYLPQMKHCKRCRSDAVGLLGDANPDSAVNLLAKASALPINPDEKRPYVAVATREGLLVNQHLGEAGHLNLYFRDKEGQVRFLERRKTPAPGGKSLRWQALARRFADCRTILTNGVGNSPRNVLEGAGIQIHQIEGLVSSALDRAFTGESMEAMVCRNGGCGSGCTGSGQGCG